MNSRSAFLMIVPALASWILTPTLARDWTQWRGPFLNGSTDEKNMPASWSKTENVIWTAPLPGPGSSTPIVCKDHIFLTSLDKQNNNLLALCIEEKTGRRLWSKKLGAQNSRFPRNEMASPSAVTDGSLAVFLFGNGDLAALDYDGNLLWQRNIQKEYGNLALMFGYSNSPFFYNDIVYISVIRRHKAYRPPHSENPLESFLLALKPRTGQILWKQTRSTDAYDESMETYMTPILYDNHGRPEILLNGADHVTAHDPASGRELWRFEYETTRQRDQRVIPSLVTGAGLIFGARYKQNGIYALKTIRQGDSTRLEYAWQFRGPAPDCSTPLFYDGLLYVLDGIRAGKTLSCLNPADGRIYWQGKIGGSAPWRASLTGADGKLYCINEASEAIVLAAGKETFKILFQFDFDEKPSRSSIVAANGRLFIRTAQNLYCFGK